MADRDELIDTDGENLAVRWFLAAYGGGVNTIHRMAIHMQQCGFGWTHPDWVIPHTPGETLTKGGAQSWLRHLFSLEAVPVAGNGEAVAQMSGDGAKDVERLDFLVGEDNCVVNQGTNGFWLCWLDGHDSSLDVYQEGSHPTARAAIDAAIAAGKHKGE
jgi:hypothetical protein